MTHEEDHAFAEQLAEKGLEAASEMMRALINQAI